jgi:transglutaminase-like putative cysteine protease
MKRFAILFVALSVGFVAVGSGCAVSEKALIKQYENITPTRFEGAVAVTLVQEEKSVVDDEGEGLVKEGFKRVKILDRKAMDCNEDATNCRLQRHVCYQDGLEKVELLEARTITPEGVVIPVEEKDFVDQTFTTWDIPDQDQRCFVWQAKGVTPGAIIEERYRTRASKIYMVGWVMFADLDPIVKSSFSLSTPKDYEYKWAAKNFDIKPTDQIVGDRLIRTWEVKDMPAFVEEYGMVAPRDVAPRIALTSPNISVFGDYPTCRKVKTWEDVGQCFNELLEKQQEATPIIKEIVAEIEKNNKTDTDKVKAVWKYLNDNVRYVGLERGLAGNVPMAAHVVCSKKYGDCKAVANLISVLCREMGIKADPVRLGTRPQLGQVDLDMPSMFPVNHSIARVEADGKVYWMDATGRDHSFDTTQARNQGVHVTVGNPEKPFLDFIPVQPPEHSLVSRTLMFEQASDSDVKVHARMVSRGEMAAYYRGGAHRYTGDAWDKVVAKMITKVYPQAVDIKQVTKGKDNNELPLELDIEARIPRALQATGKGISFEVKDPFWYNYHLEYMRLPKRRYPLDMYRLSDDSIRYEFKIPAGMVPAGLPKNLAFEDEFFKLERLVQIENDMVVAQFTGVVKKLVIPPEKYKEARRSYQKMYDASSFVLMFEPEKKKKPVASLNH